MELVNAGGGVDKDKIVTWDMWWNRKQEANQEMFDAIMKKDAKLVSNVLNEETAKYGLVADANVKLMDMTTPLHSAVQYGCLDIVDILMKHFAEVNAQDEEGICPLHLCCINGNIAMVKRLLSKPETVVHLKDKNGDTPAHLAGKALQDEILLLLVERNPDVVQIENNEGKTCNDYF